MPALQVMDQVRPAARFESCGANADAANKQQPLLLDVRRQKSDRSSDRSSDSDDSGCNEKLDLLKDRHLNVSIKSSSSCCNNDQTIDSLSSDMEVEDERGEMARPRRDSTSSMAAAAAAAANHELPIKESVVQSHEEQPAPEIKCSAVHSLERDMPDFDYSHLTNELRQRILKECQLNVGLYAQRDVDKCKDHKDTWFVERFLLRQKLDIDKAFEMLKRTMRYKNESLAASIRREDFPAEFYLVGGLFGYEQDRKGNRMLYIRLKVHRKIPEIQLVLQAFLFHNIDYLDELANGRGIAIVLDCTGAGLANADMDMLLFLISALVNYFPKGMSYLLVHELPWLLKPFWHIAKAWLSEEHRELIKFSNSRSIYEYITRENLPDFMGGTCERSYTTPPENCTTLEQACKLWGIEPDVAKRMLLKFAQYLPAEVVAKCETSSLSTNADDGADDDAANNNDNNCGGQAFDSDQENKGGC